MEVLDCIEPEIQTNTHSRFEDLPKNPMPSDEFRSQANKHIEMLYTRKAAFDKHSANAISGKELERRVHKHIVEWYAARDKK